MILEELKQQHFEEENKNEMHFHINILNFSLDKQKNEPNKKI
jgi:hypothetical protein